MPTYNFAFGVTGIPGYGDRWKIVFTGTWAFNDQWRLDAAILSTSMTIGAGDVTQGGVPTTCFTYKNRVYLGNGALYNFSDNADPLGWEVQNPGAGFVKYLSQLGGQDSVVAFSQLQGRLAVFGRKSIQMWQTDGDPGLFSNPQALDNIGTQAPLSVQNLGDYDVLFLDDTGIRSLKSRETTLNAFPDDIGTPIDSLVRAAMVGYTVSNAAGIVDPVTKNYWLHVNGSIFVFSRHTSSEVQAWSIYEPRGDDNATFVPQKFVVYNGQVFCRSDTGGLYSYGGANKRTYDIYSQVTIQTPWLDDGRPGTIKTFTTVDFILSGQWTIKASTNPKQANFGDQIYSGGSATTPDDLADSSYDIGNIVWDANGTHFSILAVSSNTSTTTPVKFSSITAHYNIGNVP